MRPLSYLLLSSVLFPNLLYPQEQARLAVSRQEQSGFILTTQHQFHVRYGLAFPLTYRFNVPHGLAGLIVMKKYSTADTWKVIPEKHQGDIFNEEEAARFDDHESCAYVSTAFGESDSLFIELSDASGNGITATYAGITKYYDNRQAAVTVSADDWFSEYDVQVQSLLNLFRSYGLYVTVGVTTSGIRRSTWDVIQGQLKKGCVEIASHSRTHPFTPYADASGEVIGSLKDITATLTLPKCYRVNNVQHVYVWLAPSGDYDSTVDSLLTVSNYLVPRLYLNLPATTPRVYTFGDSQLSAWNPSSNHFEPSYPTVELGAPDWGGGDTSLASLNNLFDAVVAKGEVYHPMWHPQVIYEDRDKPYLFNHLHHISHHANLWYVNLGPLYLYHMIQEVNDTAVTCVHVLHVEHLPEPLVLVQGEPGVPNQYVTIRAEIPKNTFVNIALYDSLAQKVSTLVNRNCDKGIYEISFDAGKLMGDTYICQSAVGSEVFSQTVALSKYRTRRTTFDRPMNDEEKK
jgi:hypothetical protein